MRTPARLFLVALTALIPAACASASGTKGAPRASGNVILEEEIRSVQATNAYDLIRRLRPHFLQKSGPSALRAAPGDDDIIVYIDDLRYGPTSLLRGISAISIVRIERLNASEATTRFGTGHPHGTIMIYTRR